MSRAGILLCVAGSALSCSLASGRTSDWNAPVSGLWSDASRWNGGIPNSSTSTAIVGLPGVYTVNMNVPVQLLGLEVGVLGALVDIANAQSLTYFGTSLVNNGSVRVNSTQGGNATSITFQDSCTIGPSVEGGWLLLNANPGSLDTAYIQTASGKVLTNAATHTIRGTGNIYARLVNNGNILADVPGRTLQLFSGPKTNNSIIRATGGGNLVISNITITQGPLGQITTDTTNLSLISATISGGSVTALGNTRIVPSGLLNLQGGVSIEGSLDIPNAQAVVVNQADLLNRGTITINPTGGGNLTYLQFNQSGTIVGQTDIILNANPGSLDTAYLQSQGGATLTIPGTTTLHGTGNLYLPFVNNSVISADVNGRTLQLLSAGKVNNGTILATAGGKLLLNNITLTQGPSGLVTTDGTDLSLVSMVINGGSVTAGNGGHIVISGNLSLTGGVSTAGPLDIPNAQAITVNQPNLIHNGVVTVNTTAGGNNTYLQFNQSGTIVGPVEIVLNANPSSLDTAYIQSANGSTLTLPPTAKIRGTGNLYVPLINNGLVHANVSGRTLQLLGGPKTNNATIKASGGGSLLINAITLNQGAGGQIVSDGSNLALANCAIIGGQMEVTGGGAIQVSGSVTFSGGANYFGPLNIPNAQGMVISQPATLHSGVTTVNQTGGGNVTLLRFTQASSIDGGELLLNANLASLDTAYLQSQSGTTTLGGQETLRGRGRLYGTFINNGTTSVGTTPGAVAQIDCQGTYTMGPESVLEVDVGGISNSQFDRVTCSGTVTVGGTIRVRLTGGYVPIGGETFDIVTGTSRAGTYTYYDIDQFPGGAKRFAVRYLPGKVQLLARGCTADYDGSGFVDTDDFTDFVLAFDAGGDDADFDGSGFTDTDDFTAFVIAFEAGC